MPTHPPTSAQIYLADQRGLVETAQQQRLSTLNFGSYVAEGRGAFGRLLAFNEESLAAGQAVAFPVADPTLLVLLPITGAVAYQGPTGQVGTVDVEQGQVLALPAGSTVQLRNPYEDAVITCLHIWLAAGSLAPAAASEGFEYSFAALENQLATLIPWRDERPLGLYLGRFQGRHEVEHRVAAAGNRLFAFVLAGAFELANRLLHAKDGLALRHCETAELEALSNDALVLLLELE